MTRASDDVFDMLHSLMAEGMSAELKRGLEAAQEPVEIQGSDGNPIANPKYRPLNPQLLNQIRQFLKDNGIDAPAKSSRFDPLVEQLGDLDLDDEALDVRTSH